MCNCFTKYKGLSSPPPQVEATVPHQTCPPLSHSQPLPYSGPSLLPVFADLRSGNCHHPFLVYITGMINVGLILELGSLRQEDHECEASLSQ